MKMYDTPYGKKSELLLMLSMEAYNRDEKAFELIKELSARLAQYAPTDATHDGLENCDAISKANTWMEKRKASINKVEMTWTREYKDS